MDKVMEEKKWDEKKLLSLRKKNISALTEKERRERHMRIDGWIDGWMEGWTDVNREQ